MPSKDVTAPERLLSVGQLAARSGVAVTALHFYESKGLIHSTRNNGNQRRFERAMLRRVAVIKMAQRLRVPLAQVAEALDTLPKGHTPTAEDWQRFSAQWREDLTQRIEELMMLRDQLDGCIGCGCMSLKECPLRNHSDRLAAEGPGPHPLGPDAQATTAKRRR